MANQKSNDKDGNEKPEKPPKVIKEAGEAPPQPKDKK
jgi:hypothetical protein